MGDKRAIIFDMDGVLIDSPNINFQTFNMALEKYGVEISQEKRKKYLGRSLRDQLEMWKEDYPKIPKELQVEELSDELLVYQMEIMKNKISPNESILKLIANAKQNGIKIAVATSSSKKRAEMILETLDILDKLDSLVTCEDVEKHKPNPDIFLETAKRIGVLPKNSIVIEDALNGIQAANAAGMISVAKLTDLHREEDFIDANLIFDSFENLGLNDLLNLF